MNWALFYVWEDARVWAQWKHSFDVHLNYLGPVSYFLHPESLQSAQLGVAAVTDGLILCLLWHSWSQAQIITVAFRALNDPAAYCTSPELYLVHSAPATSASLSFSRHTRQAPPQDLCAYQLLSWNAVLPSDFHMALFVISFRSLLKCYLITRASLLYFSAYKSLPSNLVYVLHT